MKNKVHTTPDCRFRSVSFSNWTLVFLFFLLSLFSPGCEKSADVLIPLRQEPPAPFTKFGAGLIPLAVGNQWTYIDTLESSAGIKVGTFVATIDSSRVDGNLVWYRIRNWFNPSLDSDELAIRNDSIFSSQYGECKTPCLVQSLEYIPPPDTGSLPYSATYSGDVWLPKSVTRLRQRVSVPAGYTDSCARYTYKVANEHYKEYLCPGVGVLSIDVVADSSVYGPSWHFRAHLVSYQLAN